MVSVYTEEMDNTYEIPEALQWLDEMKPGMVLIALRSFRVYP